MRAIDTNVLLRLIVHDDVDQAEAAADFVTPGAWVSHIVLAETLWVLKSVYGADASQIAATAAMLLEHDRVVLQDADAIRTALSEFKAHPKVDLVDCMIVAIARKAGHTPVGTFDKALGRIDAVASI